VVRKEPSMNFQVGDKVCHLSYGLVKLFSWIIKYWSGQITPCYVVKIEDLMLWVPTNADCVSSPIADSEKKVCQTF